MCCAAHTGCPDTSQPQRLDSSFYRQRLKCDRDPVSAPSAEAIPSLPCGDNSLQSLRFHYQADGGAESSNPARSRGASLGDGTFVVDSSEVDQGTDSMSLQQPARHESLLGASGCSIRHRMKPTTSSATSRQMAPLGYMAWRTVPSGATMKPVDCRLCDRCWRRHRSSRRHCRRRRCGRPGGAACAWRLARPRCFRHRQKDDDLDA